MCNIFHQKKPLFRYDSHEDLLSCSYCDKIYSFNNSKLRSSFLTKIHANQTEIEISPILFRCIYCALQNADYPFKLNETEMHFIPNAEQSDVIIELYQQLLITSQSEYTNYLFLLEGEAGTGKTSTITYLFKYPEFSRFKIVFSAPTNKALNVMMEKLTDKYDDNENQHEDTEIEDNIDTKRSFLTVFKLTNSTTSINSTGDTLFKFHESDDMKFKYDIIIIDEASMIEKKQTESILVSMTKLTKNEFLGQSLPTIIFMGDLGQLPPVGENTSIIFEQVTQRQYAIKKLTLTRIMRSHDRLTELSQNVRQLIPFVIDDKIGRDIDTVNFKKFRCQQINYFSDPDEWLNTYTTMFKKNLENHQGNQNINAPIILVYTNAECDSLNEECRNRIFIHPAEQFVTGELLVFKGYYCTRRQKFIDGSRQEKKIYYVKFYTSEPIIVDNVTHANTEISAFNFNTILGPITFLSTQLLTWVKKKVSQQHYDYIKAELTDILSQWTYENGIMTTHNVTLNIQFNKITHLINKLSHHYDVTYLYINGHDKLDALDIEPEQFYITVIAKQSMDQYLVNCDKIKSIIKSYYQTISVMFKNNRTMALLMDFVFQKIWTIYYYRTYIWPYANIVYGYAITTHKSQGSTYGHTFVNIGNIVGCNKVSAIVRAKSLYTAMTRAAFSIHVLYQRNVLFPIIPNEQIFRCQLCHQMYNGSLFPPINYTVDKNCANKLLSQVKSMYLYLYETYVIFSDKNKNLYKIESTKLSDTHINDVYQYVIDHNLLKSEIDRYQYSNLLMIKQLQCKMDSYFENKDH